MAFIDVCKVRGARGAQKAIHGDRAREGSPYCYEIEREKSSPHL